MDSSPLLFPPDRLAGLAFDLPLDEWQMTLAERCTLATLVRAVAPAHAIEVGTARGGSLAVIARFAGRVYSIDHDPACAERLALRHANVEFLTGPSAALLPALLDRLAAAGAPLAFALIDGSHSREAVRGDIEALLSYRPIVPLHVLIHDSFHPACRQGILSARWAENPYVHAVDLDLIPGSLHADPRWYRQLFDGFAAALLLPTERTGPLVIRRSRQLEYDALLLRSIWSPRPLERLRARVDAHRVGSAARAAARPRA